MTTLIGIGALLALGLGPADVFTVDDDGPADFASIAQAIASPLVADGDTLRVEPGSYDGFVLTKALHVIGSARGTVGVGGSRVEGVDHFSLVGLWFGTLDVTGVPGRSRIEDCTVVALGEAGGALGYYLGELRVADCGSLVVSRTYVHGDDACYPDGPDEAHPAVVVTRSTAFFVGCTLIGGQGEGFDPSVCSSHYPTAGEALIARGNSRVLVSDCTVFAGLGPFGSSRPAILVSDSDVDVRGTPDHALTSHGPTLPIEVSGASTVVFSGAAIAPPVLPPQVIQLVEPAPSLRVTGGAAPGDHLALELFGPVGGAGWVALGLDGGPLVWQSDFVPLMLDVNAVLASVPLTTAGVREAVLWSGTVPSDPALVGWRFTAQGVVAPASGAAPSLTGPADFTLRP